MSPFNLLSASSISLRKGLFIVSIVVSMIVFLPLIALISLANTSQIVKYFGVPFSDPFSPLPDNSVILYSGPSIPGDLYDFGNCTFWTAMRRAEVGEPIPNSWGNASTWASRARSDGYLVDHNPTLYSIMQIPYVDNGLGHVAFVERVDPDGEWHISEMNVVGYNEVDYKIMSKSEATNFNFIHEQ